MHGGPVTLSGEMTANHHLENHVRQVEAGELIRDITPEKHVRCSRVSHGTKCKHCGHDGNDIYM